MHAQRSSPTTDFITYECESVFSDGTPGPTFVGFLRYPNENPMVGLGESTDIINFWAYQGRCQARAGCDDATLCRPSLVSEWVESMGPPIPVPELSVEMGLFWGLVAIGLAVWVRRMVG